MTPEQSTEVKPVNEKTTESAPSKKTKNSKKPDAVPMFITHHGIETYTKEVKTEEGTKTLHFVRGSINGVPFEVECNKQVLVEPHIAEVLRGVANK